MTPRSRIITAALAATLVVTGVATSSTRADDATEGDQTKAERDLADGELGNRTADPVENVTDPALADSLPERAAPSTRATGDVAGINGVACGYPTVQAAFDAAPPGGTVYVRPGTHPASFFIDKDITITGGTSKCRPKADADPADVRLQSSSQMVLAVGSNVDDPAHDVTIRNLTLKDGTFGNLYVCKTQPHQVLVENVIIRDGTSLPQLGGGILIAPVGAAAGTPDVTIRNTRIVNNVVTDAGGGIYAEDTALTIESGGCDRSGFGVDEYCSEIRDNDAATGGGIFFDGGVLNVSQTAFIENTQTDGASAIEVRGSADATLKSVMLIGHDNLVGPDGAITVRDASDMSIVGLTSVAATSWWFDDDTTGTTSIKRTIATTGAGYHEANATTGACNLDTGGFGMPGAIVASALFTSTARTDYALKASSPAVDACNKLGSSRDIDNRVRKNGDGVPSGTEYDMGAHESSRGLGHKCAGKNATIVGSSGPDILEGTPGNDTIVALGGADVIRGRSGDDTICAGNGTDSVYAGSGRDTVYGGDKNDVLRGEKGNDNIRGEKGNDVLRGGPGNDALRGGNGNNGLHGDKGSDLLRGGRGSDGLSGGPGPNDRCYGEGGSDSRGPGCEIFVQ